MTKHASNNLIALIDEAIFIIRESIACENPAILFSGGKDSAAVAWLCRMAFAPAPVPFPLLHIDTGHNFPEVIEYRNQFSKKYQFSLITQHLDSSIAKGTVSLSDPLASRNAAQAITLLEAIEENRFGALLGGARRDEEKARSKERIFSYRNSFGHWDPKQQRPELWDLFNTHCSFGDHLRVFPISNWTELDVWEFIATHQIPLPNLYYSHQREVALRKGFLIPKTLVTKINSNESVTFRNVRFRTVGDMSCTCPILSDAKDAWEVLSETQQFDISEREATRLDDRVNQFSLENRKRQGYF